LQEGLRDVLCLNQEDIFKKFRKLHINKAPGVDGLVSNLFIDTATNMSLPLSVIYRNSLDSAIVPVDWKRAKVSVIYKKGARNKCGNYRTVSLTSQACKKYESILKDVICEHLHKFNHIRQTQHGFMSHKSCLTNVQEFLEFV